MRSHAAPAPLSIRVLGELGVARGGHALALPPSKKTRALLAYLVLTEREHQRDRLCSLLWDVTDDPRGALRWSVSKLRALCDAPGAARIVADRDAIRFESHGTQVDLLEIRARTAGDALERSSFEELEELEREFRGELLAGLALEGFDEFQGWCVAQREQARLLHVRLLEALVARSPSPERALPSLRALVRVDSLNQAARGALLELLGKLGLGAEVEQQYQAGRRLLAELGISGDQELGAARDRARRALAERTRAVSAPGSRLAAPPSAASPDAASLAGSGDVEAESGLSVPMIPFVGREREYGELCGLLEETARRGRARVALLSGEAGVGKSRIAAELLEEARRRRASVLSARAYEVESGRPYGPWIDALRQIPRAAVGTRFSEQLAVLVPEWAPDAPPARQTEEQLFGAVSELVSARAHSAPPVIIAFDDAHWLDEPSSRLLHYVARLQRHRPLLVLLTARDGELFDNAAATRTLRSLRRDGLVHELAVGPLGSHEIGTIAAHLAPSSRAARIFEESGGNPLFAIELARARAGAGEGISGTLSALIRDRVEALPQAAADALRWASVLGSGFSIERLEAVSGLAPGEVASAFEALERHALVHAGSTQERPAGAHSFSHEVVRRAVYAGMSEPRRRLMHRRVAESLEPLLASDESIAADVVHHAALAGRPDVSARACLRAAQRCVRLFASKEAEALVRRGFYHGRQLPAAERVQLELELWRVQLDARRPEESERVGVELARLGELALDHGLTDPARLAFHMLSWLRWEEGAFSDAMEFSSRAAELSRELTDAARITAMAESARCRALVESDLSSAEALLLEAEARAVRSGIMPLAIPDALGMLAWHRGELERAADLFAQARQIARREADRTNEFQALEHQFCVLLELGDTTAATALGRELGELGGKLRGGSEAPCARVLAAVLDYSGDPESGERELDAALEALRATDAKQRLAYAQLSAAHADLEHHRPSQARERAAEALRAASALSRPSDVALARTLAARAALSLGNTADAASELKALMATPLANLSKRARAAAETLIGEGKNAPSGARRKRSNGTRGGRTSTG